MFLLFLFFKQKTAYEMRISDWSSDVCSSDLKVREAVDVIVVKVGESHNVEVVSIYSSQILLQFVGKIDPRFEGVVRVVVVRIIDQHFLAEIGRASCRERVCQYV